MSRRGFAHALWPGLWLAGLLAVLAFSLSFLALRAVGIASGVDPAIAWMFPVIIDGFIVLATWATWRFRAHGLRAAWYPAGSLVVFSAVSLTGNALHAHPVEVGDLLMARWAAAAFSAVPPVALLAASHMLVMIATHRARDRAEIPAEPAPAEEPAAAEPAAIDVTLAPVQVRVEETPVLEEPRPLLQAVPAQRAPQLHAVANVEDLAQADEDPLLAWVRGRVRDGLPVSARLAHEDGVVGAESTGRRRLRVLREQHPELFAEAEPRTAGPR
ncbi:DUF2637 domain-containing protein [Cellulomonas sp. ES6]|uniref:DUF2637 domain-containing protein n=1 Tax=Cellulomonas sp. ES6 TaxID=3039384 RepID=UPI0024B63F33|nr:DUF2637 domain-containing protein [Cellulomonas sp. ES6]WHP16606.1 DUF2637 domain-containing protein [Cellulomonas sp. ES6]